MKREFTVDCHATGYVTAVTVYGDHIAACRAHCERMKSLGRLFIGNHTYRVREWDPIDGACVGPLYRVELPIGYSEEIPL